MKLDNNFDSSIDFRQIDFDKTLLAEAYRLRYRVYCNKCGFLNGSDYQDGLEIDDYDPYSIHLAAVYRDRYVVGTLRLVLANPLGFPIESRCNLEVTPHGRMAGEISRFVVEQHTGSGNGICEKVRKNLSFLSLGLFGKLYQVSMEYNLEYLFAAMEKKLWRALDMCGIHFAQIGEQIDYYGPVAPYYGKVREMSHYLYLNKPEIYANYFGTMVKSFVPFRQLPSRRSNIDTGISGLNKVSPNNIDFFRGNVSQYAG